MHATSRIGYLQRHMLEFCRRYPGPHTIAPDYETIRTAKSLQRRGLIHITDCGMSTANGHPVLMVQLVPPSPILPGESQQSATLHTNRCATGAQLPTLRSR
jgi:hypothetical protein